MTEQNKQSDAPAPEAHLVGLVERLTACLDAFTKHYDPQWMEPPKWATENDSDCGMFSKHTFGDLRKARKLIDEARCSLPAEGSVA